MEPDPAPRDLEQITKAARLYLLIPHHVQDLRSVATTYPECLLDMTADLMHLAASLGVDLNEGQARDYYLAETGRCRYCGTLPQAIADGDELPTCGSFEEITGDVGQHVFHDVDGSVRRLAP